MTLRHGRTGYDRYHCRCDICRAGEAAKQRRRYRRNAIRRAECSGSRPKLIATLMWIAEAELREAEAGLPESEAEVLQMEAVCFWLRRKQAREPAPLLPGPGTNSRGAP